MTVVVQSLSHVWLFETPLDGWSRNSNTLDTTHLKRPWCWERLKAGGEGDDRGWDGWMASPTQWTRVWVNYRSWWSTGKPGVLKSMGSQRVGHNWATELNWTEVTVIVVQSLSRIRLFETPWTVLCQASLSFTISQSLLRFMSIQPEMLFGPSHLLPPSSHFAFSLSQHQGLSHEPALRMRWPKYWSFISLSNEYSGLISFRTDWSPCSPKDFQESSSAPQFESIHSLALSLLSGPTLTSLRDYWKNPI